MTRHSTTFRFIFGLTPIVGLLFIALLPGLAQRRLTRPGTWEGEHLVNSGKVNVKGGSVAAQQMSGFGAGWSGDAQLFWGGGQIGAVLDLTIDIGEEGIYEVELHMTRAPDFGTLRIQVDGKNAAEVFDGYAPTVMPSGPVKLGSFDLQPGPRTISFVIDAKNASSSNYFAGIDFVRLNKIPVAASKTQSALEPTPQWIITAMSISPEPTAPGFGGKEAYKVDQVITVKCSYEPIVPGEARLRIWELAPKYTGGAKAWMRHDVGVTKAGSQTASFAVPSSTPHIVYCMVGLFNPTDSLFPSDEDLAKVSWDSREFQVVAGMVPSETKWPTAPIIMTPIQGGKITVKALVPSSGNCIDGGTFWFEWRRAEEISPGHWGNWQPLKMMLKPLACVPEGSTKDISGMKPGYYQVRAQLRNGKYQLTSDWSDWVEFEIVSK